VVNGEVVGRTSINYSVFGYQNPSWNQELNVVLLHTGVSIKLQMQDSSFLSSDSFLGEVDIVLKNHKFRKRICLTVPLMRGNKLTKSSLEFDFCVQVSHFPDICSY